MNRERSPQEMDAACAGASARRKAIDRSAARMWTIYRNHCHGQRVRNSKVSWRRLQQISTLIVGERATAMIGRNTHSFGDINDAGRLVAFFRAMAEWHLSELSRLANSKT